MNQQFKCPNCGEDSMHIVKTYKQTELDNYIKCGRCLHVWMTKNSRFKNAVLNTLSFILVGFTLSALLICYLERWWVLYGVLVGVLIIATLTNYFNQSKIK